MKKAKNLIKFIQACHLAMFFFLFSSNKIWCKRANYIIIDNSIMLVGLLRRDKLEQNSNVPQPTCDNVQTIKWQKQHKNFCFFMQFIFSTYLFLTCWFMSLILFNIFCFWFEFFYVSLRANMRNCVCVCPWVTQRFYFCWLMSWKYTWINKSFFFLFRFIIEFALYGPWMIDLDLFFCSNNWLLTIETIRRNSLGRAVEINLPESFSFNWIEWFALVDCTGTSNVIRRCFCCDWLWWL